MHAFAGWYTTGYIGILWNISGILLSGETVSLEKQPVFLYCYRLALGRTSSCKTLLQCIIRQFSMQLSCERGTGSHQVKSVHNSRVGVRCEHRQIASQLSHQNFRLCSWNIGTIRGWSNEVIEVISTCKVDICSLQEVR